MGAALRPASGSIRTKTLLDAMTRGIQDEFVYLRRTEKGVQTPVETLERRQRAAAAISRC